MNKKQKYIINEKINCANEFCIYQQNGFCILNEIELDICGMCASCIYINLSKNELKLTN